MTDSKIIPALHGLRGVAALSVFFYHAALIGILSPVIGRGNGITGVALFFVLSGFLMGVLYLGRPQDSGAVVEFCRARFARVYPLFAFVVILCAVLYSLGVQFVFAINGLEAVKHLLLLGEVGVFWTISVEFQFYAIFVGLWWLHGRFPAHPDVALALILCIIIAGLWLAGFPGERLVITKNGHFFAAGLLAALVARHASPRNLKWVGAALPVLLVLFVLSWPKVQQSISGVQPDTYRSLWFPALLGLICVGAATSQSIFARRVLSSRVMVYFGEVSFGIYLLHWPAMLYARGTMELGVPWPAAITIAAVATLLMANLAYKLVERPARSWLRKPSASPAAQAERLEVAA